jgi:hypothetical protein
MAPRNIYFHPQAEAEAQRAYRWYRERDPTAARAFLARSSFCSPHFGIIFLSQALCHRLVQPGLVWRCGATRTPNMLGWVIPRDV